MKKNIQEVIDQLNQDEVSISQMLEMTNSDAALIRVNVLPALVRFAKKIDEEELTIQIVESIARMVTQNKNKIPMIGVTTIAHIAIDSLRRIGISKALEAAEHLISQTPLPEREDLLWYLEQSDQVDID